MNPISHQPRISRQPLSRQGAASGLGDGDNTTATTRRRLHYVDFGRLELFLRSRLREAQNQNESSPAAVAAASITTPATAKATATQTPQSASRRGWIRRANLARRRLAHRLTRVVAGCLGGEGEDGNEGEGERTGNELRMQAPPATGARTRYQRCNNATGTSDQGSVHFHSTTPRSEAVAASTSSMREPQSTALRTVGAEVIEAEVAPAAGTLNMHPIGSSSSSSPRSVATTLTALTATQPVSIPSSTSTKSQRRSQVQNQRNTSQRQPVHRSLDKTIDDRTALLRADASGEPVEPEDQLTSLNAALNETFINKDAPGADVGEAEGGSKGAKAPGKGTGAGGNHKDGKGGKGGKYPKDPSKMAWKQGKFAKSATPGVSKSKQTERHQPTTGVATKRWKASNREPQSLLHQKGHPASQLTFGNTASGKLVTVTSEGLAWSDELASLENPKAGAELFRPGRAERRAPPLPEDPLYDPPRSVALRRNVECPLTSLMTYKTDKKGELFYSVVQLCQMCRKDVCPTCRRSLCAFCTAITCPECRMLLHQIVEITRVDCSIKYRQRAVGGTAGAAGQSLIRAGRQPQPQPQAQPYCHSCEKPICLACVDGMSMILPTNERCAQHNTSGNVYENLCPWCGRTICTECRRSACFACTKAFQCACLSNCQCDSRGALPTS